MRLYGTIAALLGMIGLARAGLTWRVGIWWARENPFGGKEERW
jgi:hypothetical protein